VDDAGVYLLQDNTALVLTCDFFTPVVDDARSYGRIAAANSLSDIYAMGASPLIALNIICFPDGELPNSLMGEILLGGQEKVMEAGAFVLGGHSVSDRELKFGLAVVGRVAPDRIVTNAAARAGDVLVLTKPLGLGVLTTALKEGELPDERIHAITEIMSTLNRAACESMLEAGVESATDVTGFGLIGHAVELAQASGVTIEIRLSQVPLIDGVLVALEKGLAPGGLFSNRHYFGRFVGEGDFARDPRTELLYDPQTSGGLLVAVRPERLGVFAEAMAGRGAESWVIGTVRDKVEHALVLA
jgi:selenide,water dikinase